MNLPLSLIRRIATVKMKILPRINYFIQYHTIGVQISQDLSWNKNTSGIMKRAQQRLYFLRKLKQASLPTSILRTFYSGVVESVIVLTYCISTWYSSCSMSDKKALQRIVRGAERAIRVSLPSVQEVLLSRCRSKALNVVRDASHPLHIFFELLPSAKWFRSQKGRTNRHIYSFLPQADGLLNCWSGACTLLHLMFLHH